jgi:general secretion pathway protein J
MSEPRENGTAGFTLIEAVAALAMTALVVGSLATMAAQWLPNWHAGFAELQNADLLNLGLERIAADVSQALYVSADSGSRRPVFDGGPASVTFVRSAIGPNAGHKLEVVRLARASDARVVTIVRSSAPFAPGKPANAAFANPVVLVREPFAVSFSYAGPDKVWRDTWSGADVLPEAVRISVRNSSSGRLLAMSTAVRLNVSAPGVPLLTDLPAPSNAPAASQQSSSILAPPAPATEGSL